MKPGVYANISNADYHAGEGESKSLLDLVRRSPIHYLARKEPANDNERAPTPAQVIGTAFHALLLEPAEFVKNYCLALRREDVPEAIEDRDVLVAMVQELNASRLAKLPTSGSKDELVARIIEDGSGYAEACELTKEKLDGMKAAELKSIIERMNQNPKRGLFPISGSRHDLAELLRANGRNVTLWSDVQAEWQANNGHRTILSQDQWDQLHRMRDAVVAHPAASALMFNHTGAVAEYSVYWRDPATGLDCRCRPDFWRKDGIIVDLKTTEDASPEEFARSIAKWRYHVQHPFYMDGLTHAMKAPSWPEGFAKPRAFVFLAVEKSARVVNGVALGVAVYVLDNESVELGRIEYQQDLATIAECKRTGVFPGYGDKIQSLSLPQWKLAKNADLLANAV